jgi:hypothetical protein
MVMHFDDPAAFPYRPGALFLGRNPETGADVGIETERHAITIAGSGAGKGAGLLIPNARRWPHNLLVVDPKGENAALSWEARREKGQDVHVIDPFRVANVPDELRASFNPLGNIDPDGFTAREDVNVIADGLVRRADSRHAEWDDGARDLIAGVLAFVIAVAPPEHRSLTSARRLLMQPNETLRVQATRMSECEACGGLAKAAGITILTALDSQRGMEKDFLGGARRHTAWLDSPAMATALEQSSFDLVDLKRGRASVYLVLPPHYIETHSAFLRLFVRYAIHVMASAGSGSEGRCLFLLDEFYSLGRINEIARAAGLMRSYGVHLWPFLQDLGQLQELYGREGAETFFGNADAHTFFGNSDRFTLDFISQRLGITTPDDVTPGVPQSHGASFIFEPSDQERQDAERSAQLRSQNERSRYEYAMRAVGSPRLTSNEIARQVGKGPGDKVARSMIVFGPSGAVLSLDLAPWFEPNATSPQAPQRAHVDPLSGAVRTPSTGGWRLLPTKGFTASDYRKILRRAAIMVLIQMLPVVLSGTARDVMMSIGVVVPVAVFVAFVTVDLKRSDFVAAARRMAVLVAIPVTLSALSGAAFYTVMLTAFIAIPIAGLLVFSTLAIFPAAE